MTTHVPILRILLVLLTAALLLPAMPSEAQTSPGDGVLYEVLADGTSEPMSMEITPDGRIVWGERGGLVWVLSPDGVQTLAGRIPTAGNLCATCDPDIDYNTANVPPNRLGIGGFEEGGLYGLLLDDDFSDNNRIYIYRSVANTREQVGDRFEGKFTLTSFVLDPVTNQLDMASESDPIIEVPAEWDYCCHYGGDLDYLPDGTIVMTTGDDVRASASNGFGPRDHRAFWDNAERTSANPADRRGKILRFTEDGQVPGVGNGYDPNPFIGMEGWNPYLADGAHFGAVYPDDYDPDGDGWVAFDPYVYSLGWKQPWRSVVHRDSGLMYTSEVGPDSGGPDGDYSDPDISQGFPGPPGYEEVNATPLGGGTHAGWPRCTGPNFPYLDENWETGERHGLLDCGDDVPVARQTGDADPDNWVRGYVPAEYYYPSADCNPDAGGCPWTPDLIGSGGKTSEPVAYYYADTEGDLRLPEAYDDRLLLLEWSRRYVLTVPTDPQTGQMDLDPAGMWQVPIVAGDLAAADRPVGLSTAAAAPFAPIDGDVHPIDGAFYMVEYGIGLYAGGQTGRVTRIRNADATPDATRNYGLPVGTADELAAMGSGLSTVVPDSARMIVVTGLGLGLAAFTSRRSRRLT